MYSSFLYAEDEQVRYALSHFVTVTRGGSNVADNVKLLSSTTWMCYDEGDLSKSTTTRRTRVRHASEGAASRDAGSVLKRQFAGKARHPIYGPIPLRPIVIHMSRKFPLLVKFYVATLRSGKMICLASVTISF